MNLTTDPTGKRDDWRTPPALFRALDDEFRFTIDAAADAANALCPMYYNRAANGLRQPWTGRVWANPPYGRGVGSWLYKAHLASTRGVTSVVLVPARTDSAWWFDYVLPYAAEVRFVQRRVRFVHPDTGRADVRAPFPSCLVVFRAGRFGPPVCLAFKPRILLP